ncbi:MOS1T transposase, partial [Pseudoatta argentina]
QSNFLLVLKMSIFVPNKVYLRGILLHCFIQKKSAAEAHRILVQTYGDNALSDTTCRDWFRRFKNNDFQLEDKERSGAPKKFQDKELEQLLDEDPSQTLSELGKILQVDESTVSKRLKGLGMIQKQGHWVPYELFPLCIWWDQQGVIYYEESASRHIATEDEKGDSRGRKTLGNSEEWDGGVGGMGDGGDERNTARRGAPLESQAVVGTVQGRGEGSDGTASRGRQRYDGGGRGGEDDRGAVSAPRAAVVGGSLLSLRSVGKPCTLSRHRDSSSPCVVNRSEEAQRGARQLTIGGV